MMNCSQFVTHKFVAIIKEFNKPINLYVFGDIHRYAKGCCEDKWFQFLDIARPDKNALFLGMGDYDDFLSQSEREIILNPKLHDDTKWTIDDIYTKRMHDFSNEIKFMSGRILGLIEGNHYGVFSSGGMTTTQMLCERLRCRYLGVNGFIRLSFIQGLKRIGIDIFAHHGKGAARLIGSSLNTVEQMVSNAEADIYLMAHDHKLNAGKLSRLHLLSGDPDPIVKDKTMIVARTGSFLKSYMPGHQSYVVKAAMKPSELGYLKIILTPTRSCVGKKKNRRKNDLLSVRMEAVI